MKWQDLQISSETAALNGLDSLREMMCTLQYLAISHLNSQGWLKLLEMRQRRTNLGAQEGVGTARIHQYRNWLTLQFTNKAQSFGSRCLDHCCNGEVERSLFGFGN
jgi:hypothetical protein